MARKTERGNKQKPGEGNRCGNPLTFLMRHGQMLRGVPGEVFGKVRGATHDWHDKEQSQGGRLLLRRLWSTVAVVVLKPASMGLARKRWSRH